MENMDTTDIAMENEEKELSPIASPQVRMRILQQMAEALEDEASSLYRRASSFEEEEMLLSQQIEDRQTEIGRIQLRLEAVKCEREGIAERVERLRREATAMREEIFNSEDEIALSFIDDPPSANDGEQTRASAFFHRLHLNQGTASR
jgi:chromosome segregation ATPase